MTSEFDWPNTSLKDFDEDDDFEMEEITTPEDLSLLNIHLLKEPAKLLADFLTEFGDNYERGFQGPIPISVIRNMDRLSTRFNSALANPNKAGYVSFQLCNVDLGDLATLVYLTKCGGQEEIHLNEKSYPPQEQPLDLAILDLQEAFIRAGGKDNQGLRRIFEGLGETVE